MTLLGPRRKPIVDFSDLNEMIERIGEQAKMRKCDYCEKSMRQMEHEWVCKNCGFRVQK